VRDALDHWQRGALPPISVHDCVQAVRLIDQAYEHAGLLTTGSPYSAHSKTEENPFLAKFVVRSTKKLAER